LGHLKIKVIPNSKQNLLVGWEEDVLKIRLKAVPDKGKANDELISFLSKILDIPKNHIQILNGHTSRLKKLQIDSFDDKMLYDVLGKHSEI
jgi:uncharacterized protein (TIGR00251 family)